MSDPSDDLSLPYSEAAPGDRIGSYKLLQRLGEGGMGTVWQAEQTEPVRRAVAIKLVKPGMDSGQFLARFEAERQALALMDHSNIARVLDAGTTATGRPYFVMELVKGLPLTRYCDDARLTLRERLALFIPVCQAIQHAHQKGIIHRDLKPSNVLVALYDGKPIPKVIDFGVAKALHQPLTERTLFTELGMLVGTPEYMAPEQADLTALDIDTRADIYSLGVLLYELLTGARPFDRHQLQHCTLVELLRLIREVEPPTPSKRLTSADTVAETAARRQTDPKQLNKLVRGDLDWIVMKCLEKERNRRYETANELALEIERYLRDEPVLAGPPSRTYRLKKFVRRNKGAVLAASLILLVLMAGIGGTTFGLLRAMKQSTLAGEERDKAERNFVLARQAVQDMLSDVGLRELENVPKQDLVRRRLVERALLFCQAFLNERRHDPKFRFESATFLLQASQLRLQLGQGSQSLLELHEALKLAQELVAARPDDAECAYLLGRCWSTLGWAHYLANEPAEAEKAYGQALETFERLDGPRAEQNRAFVLKNLGMLLRNTGRMAEAEKIERASVVLHQKLVDESPEFTARVQLAAAHNNLGNLLGQTRRLDEALAQHQRALELRRGLLRERPEDSTLLYELAMSHDNLGILYHFKARPEESEAAFDEAVQVAERLRRDFPDRIDYAAQYGRICLNRADAFRNFGHPNKALEWLDPAIRALQAVLDKEPRHGPSLRWLSNALGVRAEIHFAAQRWEQALAAWDECARLNAGPLSEAGKLNGVVCRARLGRHAEVASAAEELQKEAAMRRLHATYGKGARFDLACTLAIASGAAESDPALPSEHRTKLVESYKKRALGLLQDAFQAGDLRPDALLKGLKEDKDLESIRSSPEFQELVQSVQNKSSTRKSPEP